MHLQGLPCCRNHIGGNELVLNQRMFPISWPLYLQLFTEGCFASSRSACQHNTTQFTMVFLLTGIQYLKNKSFVNHIIITVQCYIKSDTINILQAIKTDKSKSRISSYFHSSYWQVRLVKVRALHNGLIEEKSYCEKNEETRLLGLSEYIHIL